MNKSKKDIDLRSSVDEDRTSSLPEDDQPIELDNNLHGFVERDLFSCIKVLNCLAEPENRYLIQTKQFQPLRDAFLAFNRSYSPERRKGVPVIGEKSGRQKQRTKKDAQKEVRVNRDATAMKQIKLAEKMVVRSALETQGGSEESPQVSKHIEFSSPHLIRPPNDREEMISAEMDEYDQAREEMYGLLNETDSLTKPDPVGEEKKRKVFFQGKRCYICKKKARDHWFYDSMCKSCGDFNYMKRTQECDLRGRVFLVTGGRIKIGFKIVLILLRNGARVIVTTRFPKEAAVRFGKEKDAKVWSSRLEVYGLDLRYIPGVVSFCNYLKNKLSRLDGIINNAAQTVRKPPIFHEKDVEIESIPYSDLDPLVQKILPREFQMNLSLGGVQAEDSNGITKPEKHLRLMSGTEISEHDETKAEDGSTLKSREETTPTVNSHTSPSAILSQIPLEANDSLFGTTDFPELYDSNNQRIDLRKRNSWKMELDEVGSPELIEVHMVNAFAPYLICAHLKHLMMNSPDSKKFIVNVTAMEGCFYRPKSTRHPHTNMAKASLNMMTRTSGPYYARAGIQMTCADTGWVTDENPRAHENSNFTVPLDEIDGAMRVLDPIFSSINDDEFFHTVIFKDYKPYYW